MPEHKSGCSSGSVLTIVENHTEPDQLELTDPETEIVADELTFDRAHAHTLYKSGFMEVHPHRWMRISEEIRMEDVVQMLTGQTSMKISCPFHGRDSNPSFQIYRRGNDAWCFGCPPGEQFYDAIIFTAKKLGVSKIGALQWLEKQFHLPPIADIDREDLEEEQDTGLVEIKFRDLLPPYVEHARKDIQTAKDVDLAHEYLEILFDCWPSRTEENADPDAGDPMPLARVVGPTVINYILDRKKRGK